jgi:glycosyltransferase involved in cell wall biosynthesis
MIERWVARYALRLVFTAESSLRLYRERYPELPAERCVLISNGYDEEDFRHLPVPAPSAADAAPLRLVHLGLVYPEERDPRPFFQALARLLKDGHVSPDTLRVELWGCGADKYYAGILGQLRLEEMVELRPTLPYREALRDCADASAFLVLQAASCNRQIPAKTYEYLRLRKPILALTAADGDTARLLRATGGATIVDLQDEEAIYATLPKFLAAVRFGSHPLPDSTITQRYERHTQARELAACLSSIT